MTYQTDEKPEEPSSGYDGPRTILASDIDWTKPRPSLPERGYVYFIQASETLRIKIGVAADPAHRMFQIQGHCSEQLGLGGIIPSVGPRQLELSLHKHFAAHHSHREWFNGDDEIISFVLEHALTGDDVAAELWPEKRPPGWKRPFLKPPPF